MPELKTDIKRVLRRMNLDDSFYNIGKEDYADALNVTKDAQEAAQDISITNIIGNRLVPYTKPSGTSITIGAKADILRGRVFEFMWNSDGFHSIIIYDNETRVRTKLIENLTDTNEIDVLQFTRYNKIIHCDIIYRGEDEGDLLFWTDGNVSPRKCNVKHIQDGIYTYIKTPFIELAKMPPLSPIIASYGSDTSRNANSLRKKLVMPTYRYVYDDFEKSTFTTYGKIALPIGYYGSDNDTNSAKNNFITFTVETGDENVTDIEIAVRFNTGNNWDEFILIISLNKSQLLIPDNSTYDYLFYNDSIYPPIAVDESTQLFDWVPKKAKSQCCGNGNTIELAAITEGYGNYPVNELDVTITATNVTNIPPDTDPPALTYIFSGVNTWEFTVSGSVPTGTRYRIVALIPTMGSQLFADYTSLPGDTTSDVSDGLRAYILLNFPGYAAGTTPPSFLVIPPSPGFSVLSIFVDPGVPSGGTISTEKTWLWDANYIFGLGYKDEQGRLMPGVATFVNPVNSDNDFMVTTPSFSLGVSDVQTPVISASINHIPPVGSVSYAWVRIRMTYSDFIFYETCDYQSDADYLYFCLSNIEKYKIDNSQFVYGTAPISSNSRIRIIAGITSDSYNGDIWNQDYEILGQVTKTLTGGASPADDKLFIKVKKPISAISPSYSFNMLVMVYTPMLNPTDISNSIYSEWGEEYKTYTLYTIGYSGRVGLFLDGEEITGGASGATGTIVVDDGINSLTADDVIRSFIVGEVITGSTSGATATITSISSQLYHRGMNQDQDASQAATFTWAEGDVYFHQRVMYSSILSGITTLPSDTVDIMDAGFSDFFPSSVNDNGRGLSIEPNARETYFPATIRFSREYQQNTNINETNRFFFNNFIDLDRSFGDIFKMSIKDRYIRIGQRFKIGTVPIFNQLSKDSSNSTLLASTDVLLNPVQYYAGDYGVGESPESWVDYNFSSYFFDTNRGIWCRLSLDGITPISVLYKVNSWATQNGVLRVGNFKIYGVFDSKSNNCIFAMEPALFSDVMVVSIQAKFDDGLFINKYVFSLNNAPTTGDVVSTTLTDGDGIERTYSYTAIDGDGLTEVITALNTAINADIYFTSGTQTTFPTIGLKISQVTSNNPSLFQGSTTIEYGTLSYSQAQTVSFDEENNSYESFLSFHPEMMVTLGSLLITYKDGNAWTHDSTIYNNFYGIQYDSTISPVFNELASVKKKYLSVAYQSNKVWSSPTNGDIKTSTINPQTNLQQISQLKEVDYELEETVLSAGFLYDANSMSDAREAVLNGDFLGGNWVVVKFICPTTSTIELVTFNMPYVNFIPSQRNF